MLKAKTSFLICCAFGGALVVSGCWKTPERKNTTPKAAPRKESSETSVNDNTPMKDQSSEIRDGGFKANLPTGFEMPTDSVGLKLLREYGAVFVARGVTPAPKVVFEDEADVTRFQSEISSGSEDIGGISVELQSAALAALKEAVAEAASKGKSIRPRGTDAARRNYAGTVELWAGRVEPGLKHWVSKRRMTQAEADKIKSLSPFGQVREILKLEERGIFFAKDLSKTVLYSVAPPGTSQHLSMLALDVAEHEDAEVRDILASHGWFQTVISDLPHFTYLGVSAADLPRLGLKRIENGGRIYWLPNL